MEKLIETVEVTTVDGRKAVFEIIEDASRFAGKRAYLKGSTMYYDMSVFEAGLQKAATVTRTAA
ncbi:MAG: hypothetical protein ACM3WS_03645 [Bacillota bacterium]